MRKILLLSICFLALVYNGTAQIEDDDPDLPRFQKNKISKEDFFRQKEQFYLSRIQMLQPLNYNPRAFAIASLERMEIQQRTNREARTLAPAWIQLGPSPTPNGQTTTNSVAVSGRVTAIAIHPTNSNIVYIGTANGGVYRSMNGGTSWTAIFDGAQSLAIGALALAPSNPSILYVGTGEPQLSADSYAGVGVYRIDNADASPVLNGPINPNYTYTATGGGTNTTTCFAYRSISKIIVHPTDPATIFVSTSTGTASNPSTNYVPGTIGPIGLLGLYRSTNATASAGTVSFTKLSVTDASSFDVPGTGNRRITDMVLEPGNPNNLYCWVYDVIVTSTTQGCGIYKATNALATTPSFTKTYASATASVRCEMDINKVGSVVSIYAGSGGATGNGQILKSIDGAATFTPVAGSYTFCNPQCFYDIAIAVNPTTDQKLYVGGSSGSNIFRYSTDGGATFNIANTNLHADVHALAIDPSNTNTIFLGSDGGIFKSTDAGVTWTSANTAGLYATQFQSIALHPTDTRFTIGGTQDNGTQMLMPDGSFKRVDFGDGGYTLIDQNAVNNTAVTMYHTYYNNSSQTGFTRNDNGINAADNWNFLGCSGATANGISCTGTILFYAPMALGPGNPNTVYYGSNVLYRSSDKGVNNTVVSQTMASPISTIAISKQNDNFRILGLSNGQVWACIDGSSTLTNITPTGAPAAPVSRVVINPANSNVAYVSYAGYFGNSNPHVFKTINLNQLGGTGVTWSGSATGLPDVPVNSIAIANANTNDVFLATDIGVFASIDAGATWVSYNTNLPRVPVFDLAVHPVSGVLRIATHGRGLWETTGSILPVSLSAFEVSVLNKTNVLLQWFTASEVNNAGFDVERASLSNGQTPKWQKIGFVSGSGTTNAPQRYEYTDKPTGGRKFAYRLRQTDYDRTAKYSNEKQVSLAGFDFALFPVVPNPVGKSAAVKYQLPDDGAANLAVYNSSGLLVKELFNETKAAGIYEYNLNAGGLASGTYFIRLTQANYHDSKPFIVVH